MPFALVLKAADAHQTGRTQNLFPKLAGASVFWARILASGSESHHAFLFVGRLARRFTWIKTHLSTLLIFTRKKP